VGQVVRRSTPIGAIRFIAFVQLGQGTLEKAGGHAHKADHPHPEHGTGSAEGDRHCNTCDVAAAYPARDADHQGLERTDMPFLMVHGTAKNTEHAAKVSELHEARGHREQQANAHQHDNQHLSPQKVIHRCEHARGSPMAVE